MELRRATIATVPTGARTMPPVRRLWLLRHGKSSWDDPDLPDHERPLADRGRRAAGLIATYLEANDVRPELVLCSSARRTRETLSIVLPALGPAFTARIDPTLYAFEASRLRDRLAAIDDDIAAVLFVGHNPALHDLASELAGAGSRLGDLRAKFPTCALAQLDIDLARWLDVGPAIATLAAFVVPRELGA
jgi:phosphohistidine phosphatase